MNEYREKSKKKITDLTEHIQEMQNKHRQELITLKHAFEEKIKVLEVDNEEKQKIIYDK